MGYGGMGTYTVVTRHSHAITDCAAVDAEENGVCRRSSRESEGGGEKLHACWNRSVACLVSEKRYVFRSLLISPFTQALRPDLQPKTIPLSTTQDLHTSPPSPPRTGVYPSYPPFTQRTTTFRLPNTYHLTKTTPEPQRP
jgi:hypothetical protein